MRTDDVTRIRNLFERAGLPVCGPALGTEIYLHLMGLDKKVEGGKMRFVLLREVGRAVIKGDIPTELLRQTLASCTEHG